MDVQEYERMISSVAVEMSAPDFFPAIMPENELIPDPARLARELVLLRHSVAGLERRLNALEGAADDNRNSR